MSEQQWGASPEDAAKLLGIARRTFYAQVMPYVYSGVIQSAKIGRLRRIDVESLRAWWQKQIAVK
jgi:excisionase family DNA binding protein